MKHSADGFFLSENARSARPRSAGLLSSGTGKLDKEKTAFVRQAGRTMKVLNHTAPVTWVTYSHYITMIMCRYSAGSMSELAASAKCANSPRISPALALLEEPQGKRSWMAAQEGSPNRGPHPGQRTGAFGRYSVRAAGPWPNSHRGCRGTRLDSPQQLNHLKREAAHFRFTCFRQLIMSVNPKQAAETHSWQAPSHGRRTHRQAARNQSWPTQQSTLRSAAT